MDSAAIGAVMDTPNSSMPQDSILSATTEKVRNGAPEIPEGGEEDESDDADEEQSSGDEDDEEDEDDEDDEDDEEEPVLKYSKVEGKAADILEKDTASAIAVGPTYFVRTVHSLPTSNSSNLQAVGTHNGLVHLFSTRGTLLKSYRPHSASITDIAITSPPATDTSVPSDASPEVISDTIATTSLDGQAILHALRTGSSTGHNFRRPLRTIALSPTYTTSAQKAYVTGGLAGELVLTSRAPSLGQSLGLGGLESVLTFGLAGGNNADGMGAQTHKMLHSGAGPIWKVRWKGDYIAWAVDAGVRIYSVSRSEVVAFIERTKESPRGDLWPCELVWSNSVSRSTGQELLIGWADLVKLVGVRTQVKKTQPASGAQTGGGGVVGGVGLGALTQGAPTPVTETIVEVTKVLRLDCMVSGVTYWPFLHNQDHSKENSSTQPTTGLSSTVIAVPVSATTAPLSTLESKTQPQSANQSSRKAPAQISFLLLAYLPTKSMLSPESSEGDSQRRQPSFPPELRIVNSGGEEQSRDVISLKGHERWGGGDYRIVEAPPSASGPAKGKNRPLKEKEHSGWIVLSPKGVVLVRKRDRRDRVMWLVDRERYEEALDEMEKMEIEGDFLKAAGEGTFAHPPSYLLMLIPLDPSSNDSEAQVMSKEEIGMMYLDHLFKLSE